MGFLVYKLNRKVKTVFFGVAENIDEALENHKKGNLDWTSYKKITPRKVGEKKANEILAHRLKQYKINTGEYPEYNKEKTSKSRSKRK